MKNHHVIQCKKIKARLSSTNPASRPGAHMSRLLDGIDHISNLAFLLPQWEDRSKANIADVGKVGKIIIGVVNQITQPLGIDDDEYLIICLSNFDL